MGPLKAHVENGRLRLDEPTDLPDGEEVELVPRGEQGESLPRARAGPEARVPRVRIEFSDED